jgi:hypothetical protein
MNTQNNSVQNSEQATPNLNHCQDSGQLNNYPEEQDVYDLAYNLATKIIRQESLLDGLQQDLDNADPTFLPEIIARFDEDDRKLKALRVCYFQVVTDLQYPTYRLWKNPIANRHRANGLQAATCLKCFRFRIIQSRRVMEAHNID